MNNTNSTSNGVTRKIVKSAASIARSIAKESIEGRCFFFMHEPEKPKDLAKRLENLKTNLSSQKYNI